MRLDERCVRRYSSAASIDKARQYRLFYSLLMVGYFEAMEITIQPGRSTDPSQKHTNH